MCVYAYMYTYVYINKIKTLIEFPTQIITMSYKESYHWRITNFILNV